MKLPTKAYDVVLKLRAGWELGQSTAFGHERCWIQKDGIGRGGESINIHGNTLQALLRRGLVKRVGHGFPTQRYKLVEGKKL